MFRGSQLAKKGIMGWGNTNPGREDSTSYDWHWVEIQLGQAVSVVGLPYLSSVSMHTWSRQTCTEVSLRFANLDTTIDEAHQNKPIGTRIPPAIAGGSRYSGSECSESPTSCSLLCTSLR